MLVELVWWDLLELILLLLLLLLLVLEIRVLERLVLEFGVLLERLELSLVLLLGLEQERVGEGVEFSNGYLQFLRRSVAVPQVVAAFLGQSKKKKGDQHQRKGVCPDDAADLSGEISRVTKRTGCSWRSVLGRRRR